jgi:GT2 family glycosyltransferase
MNISIVITTKDRRKDLLDCLSSIGRSDFGNFTWEVIVIDDCSSDGTQNVKSDELGIKNCRIIHNKSQQMMVKSRNIGARESAGGHILFIDDDNIIDSKMIKILINFLDQNVSYGIVGPSMHYFDTKKKYLDYQKINLSTGRTVGFVSESNRQVYDSDGIPNVFMIRREVFKKCGYFDEALIQTFTEPDFAMKAGIVGFKCGVVPKAITYHKVRDTDNYKPRALGGKFNQKAYCLIRNRTVYVARYGSTLNRVVYILIFSFFWPAIYSILALVHSRKDLLRMYWMGFVDGFVYFFAGKMRNSLKSN